MNEAEYCGVRFINSDGRHVGTMNVHHAKLADKILEWLAQQAGGEVTVQATAIDFANNPRVDP